MRWGYLLSSEEFTSNELMIGAVSQVRDLPVTTAVTCPTVRIHPGVIAQAAATSASLLDGFGAPWPPADVRLAMLEESVEVMRS